MARSSKSASAAFRTCTPSPRTGSNEGDTKESRLPAPEQPLLTRLTQDQLAELIERHIDYVDDTGRSVHLAAPFVRHYLERTDDALPVVAAIATLPVVLPDGTILAGHGLVRERGIVFRIPERLMAMLPTADECDDEAVQEALTFLTDTWLCDVATDYTGKCILIAAALTLIERSLLPDRPVFFVTAGRRGGGKTTTLIMLLMAVTGVRPSAAAWSPNEEERRKALLAYLMEALPAIIWDNIPRGTQISCPHIERSCTTAFYSDRRLGVSELVAVAAAVIHLFTGNNIGPRGDLASRALTARLEVERPDPENRPFTHPDPIGWTEAHRGRDPARPLYDSAWQPEFARRTRCRAENPLQALVAGRRVRRRACGLCLGWQLGFPEAVSVAGRGRGGECLAGRCAGRAGRRMAGWEQG